MFFKVFFATKDLDTVLAPVHSITTMDIHLMFDNFGLKCALNASFCVQYVFDELG
jgi:hypothetical protein